MIKKYFVFQSKWVKKLFDKFFQCIQVLPETFSSFFGDSILGVGLPADELLGRLDISDRLQCF